MRLGTSAWAILAAGQVACSWSPADVTGPQRLDSGASVATVPMPTDVARQGSESSTGAPRRGRQWSRVYTMVGSARVGAVTAVLVQRTGMGCMALVRTAAESIAFEVGERCGSVVGIPHSVPAEINVSVCCGESEVACAEDRFVRIRLDGRGQEIASITGQLCPGTFVGEPGAAAAPSFGRTADGLGRLVIPEPFGVFFGCPVERRRQPLVIDWCEQQLLSEGRLCRRAEFNPLRTFRVFWTNGCGSPAL